MSGGVIEDDLPAGGCLLEDKREDSLCVTTPGSVACEVEAAGNGGDARIKGRDLEIGEGELPHLVFIAETRAVALEDFCVSVLDILSDKSRCVGIFVSLHEGVDIAAIPGRNLCVENGMDGGLGVAARSRRRLNCRN